MYKKMKSLSYWFVINKIVMVHWIAIKSNQSFVQKCKQDCHYYYKLKRLCIDDFNFIIIVYNDSEKLRATRQNAPQKHDDE